MEATRCVGHGVVCPVIQTPGSLVPEVGSPQVGSWQQFPPGSHRVAHQELSGDETRLSHFLNIRTCVVVRMDSSVMLVVSEVFQCGQLMAFFSITGLLMFTSPLSWVRAHGPNCLSAASDFVGMSGSVLCCLFVFD